MADYLEHKNGYKYIDKYRSKSGKWVYLYKVPGHKESETDIITGKTTEYQTPDKKVYFRDSNKLLSSKHTTQTFRSHGKSTVNEYRSRGKIERAYDNAPRNISRAANRASRSAKRTITHVRDFSERTVSNGRRYLERKLRIKW